MPKINDLTTRPGGPQPTDEFWLASAGGAADFKSTIDALTTAVLGNIGSATFPVNTFSPVIEGSTGNPTVTYTEQAGWYIRLGNLVWVATRVDWSALSGGSGNVRVTLPIAGATNNAFSESLPVGGFGVTFPTNATAVTAFVRPGGSPGVELMGQGSGLSDAARVTVSGLASTGRISFSGVYRV